MKISLSTFLSRWLLAALVTTTLPATAGTIDVAKSQITANFRQMNVPVEGRFTAFSGSISFDAKNITASRARIEIDTASFDVGAPEYNDELRAKEWLHTSAYPKASFISSRVTSLGQNRFEVTGKLTLKGKTLEIKVPFTLRTDSAVSIYEGEVPLSRKTYSLGSADWEKTVEDKVIVKFRIAAAAK